MEEHPDVTKTIEILPAQVIGIGHHTINLAQGAPMAEVREKIIMVTIIGQDKKVKHQSCTFIPAGAEDEDWDEDLGRAAATIQQAHQSYQVDQANQEGATPLDDHITPCDYYSNPPEPQPGSYPGGEQLTSRNTTYAELQSSLITQEEENLVL